MLKKLSDFLSSHASLFVILTAVVTFFVASNPMAVVPCAISCCLLCIFVLVLFH